MTNRKFPLLVVAVALERDDGCVLMQRRRQDRAHGGLWEFPGGKLEPGENAHAAALREIAEELGVTLSADALEPLGFAGDADAPAGAPLIVLFGCRRWQGEPRCLDGEEIAWVPACDIAGLDMPPLDYPLARALLRARRGAVEES